MIETRLSAIDGDAGTLTLGGWPVQRLAGRPFEAVVALLWDGPMPDAARTHEIGRALGRGRAAAFGRIAALGDALFQTDAMDALRACVSHLHASGDDAFADAAAVIAAIPVFAAAWHRTQTGADPIAPDPDRGHAEDALRMITGADPTAAAIGSLNTYFCAVADHGMNASTFAARVVASTDSDLVSAIVAALGALKGPLHGGAPAPVLEMLDAIGTAERAQGWIAEQLAAGKRIMGIGHRVYRVRDPRAVVLDEAARAVEADPARRQLARTVEETAVRLLRERHPDRGLFANVELYTALLLEALHIPRTLFTPTFAAARAAGWCAHVREQRALGRLIRPRSRYIGPAPAVGSAAD